MGKQDLIPRECTRNRLINKRLHSSARGQEHMLRLEIISLLYSTVYILRSFFKFSTEDGTVGAVVARAAPSLCGCSPCVWVGSLLMHQLPPIVQSGR